MSKLAVGGWGIFFFFLGGGGAKVIKICLNLIRFGQNQNLASPKTFDFLRLWLGLKYIVNKQDYGLDRKGTWKRGNKLSLLCQFPRNSRLYFGELAVHYLTAFLRLTILFLGK